MPLPLIPLAMGAARMLPAIIGGAVGSAALEGIGSAIAGSPSEEQAREAVGPLFNREVARLMATGLSMKDAETKANDSVAQHIKESMGTSNLPDWASLLLSTAGGIGGWALGAKSAASIARKLGAKAASAADAAIEDPLKKTAAKAVAEGSGNAAEGAAATKPFPKFTAAQEGGLEDVGEPAVGKFTAAQEGGVDDLGEYGMTVVPRTNFTMPKMPPSSGFTGGSAPMSENEAAFWRNKMSGQNTGVPDIVGPFPRRTPRLGMSPETGRGIEVDKMRRRLYGKEGD